MNEKKRQKCEVYSRVVGYLRPVSQWNEGKQEEFLERKEYSVEEYENRRVAKIKPC
jgi:ribonucleoside-triphosphate reductase (formate)